MADRYLQHRTTGQVFIWQPQFESSGEFTEVADAQGTPLIPYTEEVTPEVVAAVQRKSRAKAKAAKAGDIDFDLDDLVPDAEAALSADASRGA